MQCANPTSLLERPPPHRLAPVADSVWAGFPRSLTPFFDRTEEIAPVQDLLRDPGQRWSTLPGPGGVGKTRRTIAAREALDDAFPGGAAFLSLTAATSPDYAIELAAAWVRLRLLPALLERPGGRLPLLSGGATDQPARLQTRRAASAWSRDRLTPGEARLLRRLGAIGAIWQRADRAVPPDYQARLAGARDLAKAQPGPNAFAAVHAGAMRQKLGVSSRSKAAVQGMKLGLDCGGRRATR